MCETGFELTTLVREAVGPTTVTWLPCLHFYHNSYCFFNKKQTNSYLFVGTGYVDFNTNRVSSTEHGAMKDRRHIVFLLTRTFLSNPILMVIPNIPFTVNYSTCKDTCTKKKQQYILIKQDISDNTVYFTNFYTDVYIFV